MPMSTTLGFAFVGATVSNTALTLETFGFTEEQVNAADRARITCATNGVRYRYDGPHPEADPPDTGAPTASVGHLLAAAGEVIISGNTNLLNLQLIRATGSDAAVSITLEKF